MTHRLALLVCLTLLAPIGCVDHQLYNAAPDQYLQTVPVEGLDGVAYDLAIMSSTTKAPS